MMNQCTLFLMSMLYIPMGFASSAPAAAAAGAGASSYAKATEDKGARQAVGGKRKELHDEQPGKRLKCEVELKGRKQPLSFETKGFIYSAIFSPNGLWLAVASQNYNEPHDHINVFSVEQTTGVLKDITGSPFLVNKGPSSIAYSPNSKWLAVLENDSNNVAIFSVGDKTGSLTKIDNIQFPDETFNIRRFDTTTNDTVAYSPNGKWLTITNEIRSIVLTFGIDQTTGRVISKKPVFFLLMQEFSYGRLNMATLKNNLITYSVDGKWFAAVGTFKNTLTVMKVNEETGSLERLNNEPLIVGTGTRAIAYSPDSKWFAYLKQGDDYLNKLMIFSVNAITGALTLIPKSLVRVAGNSVGYSPNGKWLAAANSDEIKIFSVNDVTGKLMEVAGSPFFQDHDDGYVFGGLSYSPNSRLFVYARGSYLWVYEVDQETGALSRITGDILKDYQKSSAQAQKVLKDEGNIPIPGVLSIVDEYIVGQRKAQPAQTTNDAQE